MRTIDSSISVLKPSNIAWWHTSWTGRFILAALLIAAAAFVLTPGRTSAQTTTPLEAKTSAGIEALGGLIPTGDLNDVPWWLTAKPCVALQTRWGRTQPLKMSITVNWIGVAEAVA